jgi:hypothetical protein
MKKTILTTMMMGLMLIGFAQRQMLLSEYYVTPQLAEEITAAKVADLRANNPAELLRVNYTMFNFAVVTTKLWDGNLQQMGMLEQYLPEGTTYLEEDIIQKGYVNPYKWNLPQDMYRYNVYKLRRSGYYVIVMPKVTWDERLNAHLQQYGF